MEYRNFKIVQQQKIVKYEKNKVSGHSWPVYKVLNKYKIDVTERTRGVICSMLTFNSIKTAQEQIDFMIKYVGYHSWCTNEDINRINIGEL